MKSRVIVAAIIKKDGKFLLGSKPKGVGPYPDTWHLLGGGANLEEENLEEAIRREIKEEAGIELLELKKVSFDDGYEPDKHKEMTHYVFLVFEGEYKSGEVRAGDDIVELKWFTNSELKSIPLPKPTLKVFKELGYL